MTNITDSINDNPTPTDSTPTEGYLLTLVGEGKKYADENALAKAYYHSNLHIEELKTDNQKLSEQQTLLQSILDELQGSTPSDNAGTNSGTPNDPTTTVSPEQTRELVRQELEAHNIKAESARILVESISKLTAEFNGKETDGLNFINSLIQSNPNLKGVIDGLGNTDSDAFITLIRGYKENAVTKTIVQNTPGTANAVSGEQAAVILDGDLTWAKATEVRKADPRLYNSPEFRQQLEAAVAKSEQRGVDFFKS